MSIYDSRNFNELGNTLKRCLLNYIYDSRNFNELGNVFRSREKA